MRPTRVLRPGDKIGIAAPSAVFDRKKLMAGVRLLKKWGYRPELAPHLFEKDFIFSGTFKHRLSDLYSMLKRKDIAAVWCVRGGWGAYDIAQELAARPISRFPKLLIGHSDATAIQLVLTQKWKWPVIHGPFIDRLGSGRSGGAEVRCVRTTISDSGYRLRINRGFQVIRAGRTVEASLTGGSLTLAACSIGSKWEIDTRGKILFLEDVGERAYRIDRMLFQLEAAGKFERVKAVVLGDFTDCVEPDGKVLWPEMIRRRFGRARFPVILGVTAGHGDVRLSLPMGVRVRVQSLPRPAFSVVSGF